MSDRSMTVAKRGGEEDRTMEGSREATARKPKSRSVGQNLWWFVLPAIAFYLVVVIVPTIQGMVVSFTDRSSLGREWQFIGFENYAYILQGELGAAAVRTLAIAVTAMVINNAFGLALALALHRHLIGRNVLRTLIFAPAIVAPLVVGYLFRYIFGPPEVGAINGVLELLNVPQVDWLGNPAISIWVVILVLAWQFSGISMVIYLAGLEGVPPELLEAASIDGAGPLQQFWYVTRPLLAPAILVNLMLSLIGGLKIFDQILAMTGGGPAGMTDTLSTIIYKQFTFGELGRSAALAVMLTIVVAVLSTIQFRVLRQEGDKA